MRRTSLKEKGITLVALVVTIIVLLILAGVTINMAIDNNGLIQRTENAKETTERAEIIENAQMDIIDRQAKNHGVLSESELYEILTSEDYQTQGTLESNSDESILNATLISNDGKHEIKVYEIYNGDLSKEKPIKPVVLATFIKYNSDTITITPKNNQTWYEWANDPDNSSDVILSNSSSVTLKSIIRKGGPIQSNLYTDDRGRTIMSEFREISGLRTINWRHS